MIGILIFRSLKEGGVHEGSTSFSSAVQGGPGLLNWFCNERFHAGLRYNRLWYGKDFHKPKLQTQDPRVGP